jgi:hypothetical protein
VATQLLSSRVVLSSIELISVNYVLYMHPLLVVGHEQQQKESVFC